MSGSEEISRRAAAVEDAARSVRATRAVVDGLGSVRWRSAAALAFKAEVARAVDDLARTGAWLESLAADLRRLAALLAGGRHG